MKSLSIYLLKSGVTDDLALNTIRKYKKVKCDNVPADAALYLAVASAHDPWWKSYLGLSASIEQQSQGAVLILPIGSRRMAVTFGMGKYLLSDVSYECDFGLICTLNAVEPSKLKSVDSLQPYDAKRRRVQMPSNGDLSVFDVVRTESVLNKMTGMVREKYKNLFRTITGGAQVNLSADGDIQKLHEICSSLLDLYGQDVYKETFPELRNVCPVKDPELVKKLDERLVMAVIKKDDNVLISIPEVVDYAAFSGVRFGCSDIFELVAFESFCGAIGQKLAEVDLEKIKHRYPMMLVNSEGDLVHGPYSLYKCLTYDCELNEEEHYHFCDGMWYKIDEEFLEGLNQEISALFRPASFPPNSKGTEEAYNQYVAQNDPSYLCIDRNLINMRGVGKIEPCDLYKASNGEAEYVHVKIGTVSSRLSHLFNQGGNSAELLASYMTAREKFKEKIPSSKQSYRDAVDSKSRKIVFLIITPKQQNLKENAIPFFSKLSLRRVWRQLSAMGMDVSVQLIKDDKTNSSRKKPRKPRKAGALA